MAPGRYDVDRPHHPWLQACTGVITDMTANQRRSGFRLPWVSEDDEPGAKAASTESGSTATSDAQPTTSDDAPAAADTNGSALRAPSVTPAPTTAATPEPEAAKPSAGVPAASAADAPEAAPEPPGEFLRDLIAAMRAVADEARETGVAKLKADAEEAVRMLEADAERRRQDLRERADTDVSGVAEWARAEAERIKTEAEQRVAARRAELERQLAADGTRTEAETKALRSRVADYQRELDAYHAQLIEINDPAAFAAAAKRMPRPPELTASLDAPPSGAASPADPASAPSAPANAPAAPAAPEEPAVEVHPAEEEVLAARLAALDEKLEATPAAPPDASAPPAPEGAVATPAPAAGTQTTTDIVVKGLGSFGAITGFRQSLSSQEGIAAVALSLGQTGEFVFRATHAAGFDLPGAITAMEGENAKVEPRPEGGLRVTLERSR